MSIPDCLGVTLGLSREVGHSSSVDTGGTLKIHCGREIQSSLASMETEN